MSDGIVTEAAEFTLDFLRSVVDTLLPGLPATDRFSALPAASQLGIHDRLNDHLRSHSEAAQLTRVLEAIVEQAGGPGRFTEDGETAAVETLGAVETANTTDFLALLFVVSADYYESGEVLEAFGWRATPPQPLGYELAPFDEDLLATVKARPRTLWRQVRSNQGG